MYRLADKTSSARNERDEEQLPAGFGEARAHVRNAIKRAERDGILSETLGLALLSEALPRIVHEHGPAWTAEVLARLAQRIDAGSV